MVRKDTLTRICIPWSSFVHSCFRVASWSWDAFLFASEERLEIDRSWARNRKASLANCTEDDALSQIRAECVAHDLDFNAVCTLWKASTYTQILNCSELRRLYQYIGLSRSKKHVDPSWLTAYLGQDPYSHPQYSVDKCMGAVFASGSLLWAEKGKRFFGIDELFSMQGCCYYCYCYCYYYCYHYYCYCYYYHYQVL